MTVIVVGAGVAGLAAASRLQNVYGVEALTLEARERLGGRVHTSESGAELGAEFLHGRHSVTWKLLSCIGMTASEYERHNPARRRYVWDRSHLTDRTLDALVTQLYVTLEGYHGDAASLASAIRTLDLPGDERVEFFVGDRIARLQGADLAAIGTAQLRKERELNVSGWENHRISGPYSRVIDFLAAGLHTELDTIVQQVSCRETFCEVMTASATFTAQQVIVTVPLPLLDSIVFDPGLPKLKLAAAQRLKMGHANKVIVELAEPQRSDWDYVHTNGLVRTWWRSAEDRILIGFSGGSAAAALRDDAATAGLVRQELAFLLGGELAQSSAVRIVDWSRDPWSRGAYSYSPPGSDRARLALAEPVGRRLFFAGEATSLTGAPGTVHGAIESGWRAADQAVACGASF